MGNSPNIGKEGLIYAILAYSAWGLLPLYWKLFGQIPALEVLSHRIIWSMLLLLVVLIYQGRSMEFAKTWRSPRQVLFLLLTASLLTVNWGLYIYGVNSNRVIETSLGYFINPLVNVLLGVLILNERMHSGQQIAVVLAIMGVANLVWQVGEVPWIALTLAFSFAFYGLVRKLVPVSPMVGLTVETILMTPLAVIVISHGAVTNTGNFHTDTWLMLLFIGAGIMTSLPLLWFNNAALRLPLSTLGFFQYLAPTLQLLLGVFLYGETFSVAHRITFGLIWSALLTYSLSSLLRGKSPK